MIGAKSKSGAKAPLFCLSCTMPAFGSRFSDCGKCTKAGFYFARLSNICLHMVDRAAPTALLKHLFGYAQTMHKRYTNIL
jgi:hypothetical protein